MSTVPLSITKRWILMAAFVLARTSAVAAQGASGQLGEEDKVFERLRQPQLVPYWVPENERDETIGGRDDLEGMSADEREVRLGGVQKRLINLAITGRITRQEYEGFVRRLQGN
jgi:hypothetical protein